MRPRLIILLVLLVALPLGMVLWLGARGASDEAQLREQRLTGLLDGRLRDVEARVGSVVDERGAQVSRVLSDVESLDHGELRELVWSQPLMEHVFVLRPDGRLIHPPLSEALSQAERDFLQRTRRLFEQGLLVGVAGAAAPDNRRQLSSSRQLGQSYGRPVRPQNRGWYSWYWDSGLHLIAWVRDDNGVIRGCEVNRSRLMADILTELSDLTVGGGQSDAIVLTDSRGRTLQRWGGQDPEAVLRAERSLRPPLGAWRLSYLRAPEAESSVVTAAARWVALGVMTVALVGLGLMFYREGTRELEAAARRVSFVNQVSHELRTPLTNIRLYAELLLDRTEACHDSHEPLEIIVAESQRLSRLIGNVLSFARRQRGELKVRPRQRDLATTVRTVVERFTPSLEAKGIRAELTARAEVEVLHDADAVEQILGNLLNNVEKYAASGGWVGVAVEGGSGGAVVTVSDRGPGVPPERAEDAFEPFVRLSSELTEGVSGTGIGLSLSRDLARLHGGDLVLVDSDTGASFELRLPGGEQP